MKNPAISNPQITIKPVNNKQDLRKFIDLPYQLHQGKAYFVPPLRLSEWEMFDPEKNPFYEHARMNLYLALQGGDVVGRVAFIDEDLHNQTHHENIAFFGFFEATSLEVAKTLIAQVESEARACGRDAVRGPANPSLNDSSGFQIDAFDTPPYIMMTGNPPSYPTYMEQLDYAKIKDLYAWFFDNRNAVSGKLERITKRMQSRYNITLRHPDLKNLDAELAILKHIYNEAWETNWGHVRYTDAEFDKLAEDLKLIVDPNVILFMEKDGEPVALAICLPNINEVFARMPNGRLLPRGIPLLLGTKLDRKRFIHSVRLPILGVMPKYRNKGFEAILIYHIARAGIDNHYTHGELSWILEDNDSMNNAIASIGAVKYKTYRIYQKPL